MRQRRRAAEQVADEPSRAHGGDLEPAVATEQRPEPSQRAHRGGARTSEDDSAADEVQGVIPGMMFGGFDGTDDESAVPFQGPRMEDQDEPGQRGAKGTAPAIGEDLRQLRKDDRRKLDLEDPFK